MSSVRNLKQAILPIIWLNCIFCMGIFEIPINRPRYFLTALYIISMWTGYSILFYQGMFIFKKANHYEFITFNFVFGVNVLVAVLAIVLFWYKSENMNSMIKRNSIVDNTLEALGIKPEYQKIFRNILHLIAIWIVGIIMLNIMNVLWMYRDTEYQFILYSNIYICFPIMINSVVDLTFASFIKLRCGRCVQQKFQKINILLNNVVLCANESNNFKIRNQHDNIIFVMANYKNHKDKITHFIQTLRLLHLEITRIARQTNRAYCLQLLLELAVHFTIVTSAIYCLYGIFSGKFHQIINNEKIVAMAMWAIIYSLKIILMNNLCTNVSREAYKTGEIIQSFEGSIIDDNIREEIQQFIQQIELNSLNFTAFGFFAIDNSLTGKFFASVTTYVIILIQMNTPI